MLQVVLQSREDLYNIKAFISWLSAIFRLQFLTFSQSYPSFKAFAYPC